jgi:uncharacterized protein
MTRLRMNVSDLLRHPGSARDVHLEVPIAGFENRSARLDEHVPLVLDLHLVGLSQGVVASGRVRGRWSADCSRCLNPIQRDFDLRLREVFEDDPVEEETYPLVDEHIDLEQPLRDLVVPDLPIVPLCDPECLGLCPSCGADRNEGPCGCETARADPRWEALRNLDLFDGTN